MGFNTVIKLEKEIAAVLSKKKKTPRFVPATSTNASALDPEEDIQRVINKEGGCKKQNRENNRRILTPKISGARLVALTNSSGLRNIKPYE